MIPVAFASSLPIPAPVLVLFVIALFVLLWRRRVLSCRTYLPLPPGPRPLPVIGNLLDLPVDNMEARFRDMSTQYGDIVYLSVCGQPMVILGTQEAAIELLDKRAPNYSDRKLSSMAELTGLSWLLTAVPYGDRWRAIRRAFHRHMNANVVTKYRSVQERETKNFLVRLLENPKEFSAHGRFIFGAAIIRIVYGLDVAVSDNEKYIRIAEEAMTAVNLTFLPGKYLAETFPILRYIPRWFPGAQFKRDAASWRPAVLRMRNASWTGALEAMREGKAVHSMVLDFKERGEDEDIAKDTAASVYLGASDTTLTTLQTFFAAMATYPGVQKRAQAELDAVVGPHRLPMLDDEKHLPYISALIKECLRWKLVVPLGVAHVSTEEDEYKGYRIPKGSVMVPNIWAYSRDLKYYTDPEEFRPERFLKDGQLDRNVLDPSMLAFGYGRRVCPGKHFAQTTLFTLLSSILHTFWISLPADEYGNPVPLNLKSTQGTVSYLEPFECSIKPRSPAAETLLRTLRDEQRIAEEMKVEV